MTLQIYPNSLRPECSTGIPKVLQLLHSFKIFPLASLTSWNAKRVVQTDLYDLYHMNKVTRSIVLRDTHYRVSNLKSLKAILHEIYRQNILVFT